MQDQSTSNPPTNQSTNWKNRALTSKLRGNYRKTAFWLKVQGMGLAQPEPQLNSVHKFCLGMTLYSAISRLSRHDRSLSKISCKQWRKGRCYPLQGSDTQRWSHRVTDSKLLTVCCLFLFWYRNGIHITLQNQGRWEDVESAPIFFVFRKNLSFESTVINIWRRGNSDLQSLIFYSVCHWQRVEASGFCSLGPSSLPDACKNMAVILECPWIFLL